MFGFVCFNPEEAILQQRPNALERAPSLAPAPFGHKFANANVATTCWWAKKRGRERESTKTGQSPVLDSVAS